MKIRDDEQGQKDTTVNLKGKTALVTGGALRIGRAICNGLASQGCNVVIHANRSVKQASSLAGKIRQSGADAFTVTGDLVTSGACELIVEKAIKLAGKLDILINNAGIFRRQSFLSASEKEIRNQLEVNIMAPIKLIRAFGTRVGKGKIVNLLDCHITSNMPGLGPYLLSKRALAELTKLAARELAPAITVNGIAPGPIISPATHNAIHEKAGQLPLRKRPLVQELVKAMIFLLESDFITGQVLFVDSGQHLLGSEEE